MLVQRLCALVLAVLSAWLLVAPLAATTAGESLLPACCRRAGAHNCAGIAFMRNMGSDRTHATLNAGPCKLMPHHALGLLERFTPPVLGTAGPAYAAFLFVSPGALHGYARALALKSPRGPPANLSVA